MGGGMTTTCRLAGGGLLIIKGRLYAPGSAGVCSTPPPAPPLEGEGSRNVFLPLSFQRRASGGGVLSSPPEVRDAARTDFQRSGRRAPGAGERPRTPVS